MTSDTCCGWHGTVPDFLALDQATLLASLSARHLQVMGLPPSGEQMAAWRGEYEMDKEGYHLPTEPPDRSFIVQPWMGSQGTEQ